VAGTNWGQPLRDLQGIGRKLATTPVAA